MNRQYRMADLRQIMARLRDPVHGCPWDLQQTFGTIAPHTIEETYELVDAIERNDIRHIQEELGDVLFQVIFYAQLGQEQGVFDFDAIVHGLCDKLVRRHPHVFVSGLLDPDQRLDISMAQIKENWESIKKEERLAKVMTGVLDDVPLTLPALTRSVKLQKRASQVGFDWPDWQAVLPKVEEELAELEQALATGEEQEIAHELGDVFFALSNLARHLKLDPESVMRQANHRFEQRFRYVESALTRAGKSPAEASLQEMDALWEEAKKAPFEHHSR